MIAGRWHRMAAQAACIGTLYFGGMPGHVAHAQAAFSVTAAPAVETKLRALSLRQCLEIALKENPDLIEAHYEVAAAAAEQSGARGEFGPKLRAEANAMQWNSPFDLPFGNAVFRARDAFTWTTTVSLIQPITGLFAIYDNYQLQKLGLDVAAIHQQASRRDVLYRVEEAYYRVLEAARVSAVAETSVSELTSQLTQANALHDNGVTDRSDVLRAELALANARQRLIDAQGQHELARMRLGTAMGLVNADSVDAVPIAADQISVSVPQVTAVEQRALADRIELREVDRRIDQREHAISFARAKLAPRVDLMAAYQHNEGSAFIQKNAGYVGVFASWDVWDWGTTGSHIDVAVAQLRQAETARQALQAKIRLEVREAYVHLQAAAEAMTVASAAIAQAEENYRLVTKRYAASVATAFDTIDAEALLTRARGQLETSRYDYLVAQVALRRASGQLPDTGTN